MTNDPKVGERILFEFYDKERGRVTSDLEMTITDIRKIDERHFVLNSGRIIQVDFYPNPNDCKDSGYWTIRERISNK